MKITCTTLRTDIVYPYPSRLRILNSNGFFNVKYLLKITINRLTPSV